MATSIPHEPTIAGQLEPRDNPLATVPTAPRSGRSQVASPSSPSHELAPQSPDVPSTVILLIGHAPSAHLKHSI